MDLVQFCPRALFALVLRLLGLALLTSLAACSNLSGLGASSEFQCKAPEGIPCQSISGVHFNERAGNLPAQRAAAPASTQDQPDDSARGAAPGERVAVAYRKPATPSAPAAADVPVPLGAIRSDPTVIRIWIAPWEDTDGDLHDQSYVYLQVDSGRWLIEHNRAQIRREFAPQRPVAVPVASSAPAASAQRAALETPRPPTLPGPAAMSKNEAAAIGRALAQSAKASAATKPSEAQP